MIYQGPRRPYTITFTQTKNNLTRSPGNTELTNMLRKKGMISTDPILELRQILRITRALVRSILDQGAKRP
jgi:hypothetical protein